ncbi:MAG: hypothetical protein WCQ97_04865 [Aminobacterium sp.]|jgi:hypothetical protein|uniref:hypothetical protein n=1 Tax=unclassified Aminobacterium TaxID=2685012 RepID=UPI001BCBEEBE|nr:MULTISPECIES: hypothetical protein [unclassified Aminobacterium]MDD2207095.1 hypothetical protein [Aminobacterium sp.]MDD3426252.1 hypothetical protein [Aminobacterium sp.]MDD3707456.1 hypothetical protein [Aminobacterium sp.]MDD4228798.1 hypothetical protein [Aminobacterium sp.]MDD4550583.1 hypothetical protein [Aminobacterium sp.]
MVVNPVHLQLAHWNVEQNTQSIRGNNSPAALAGQQGEIVSAAIQKEQVVQAGDNASEGEKTGRKKEKEERSKKERQSGSNHKKKSESQTSQNKNFDLYA